MKQKWLIVSIVLLSCIWMAIVDGIIQPQYFVKSAIKFALFFALPIIFFIKFKSGAMKSLFKLTKKSFLTALLLGFIVYSLIVGGYLLLKSFLDLSQVTEQLSSTIGVNASNFIYVAIYISLINSFLEEFFFRGFSFITLKKFSSRKFAYVFSSITFALYHVAMMIGWFSFPLFMLALIALSIAGVTFNWLNEKFGSIYVSWIVHLCANLGINTVGLVLFEII